MGDEDVFLSTGQPRKDCVMRGHLKQELYKLRRQLAIPEEEPSRQREGKV